MENPQIEGPQWLTTEKYDVVATISAGAGTAHVPEMLQTLLASRFKLLVRQEKRDTPVYALVVAPGGLKMKPTQGDRRPMSMSAGLQLQHMEGSTSIDMLRHPGEPG